MASIGTTCLLFLIITCIRAGNSSFVQMECEPHSVGQYGHQSMLECVVRTSKDVVDAEISMVTWRKVGVEKPLLFFNEGATAKESRVRFAETSWNNKNMNVSLLITNTMLVDIGSYQCYVMTNSGDSSNSITLNVTEKYDKPTIQSMPTKMIENIDVTLYCHSTGGYPKGQLRWFDVHKQEWTKSSKMEAKQMDNGLFSLSSELPLSRGSIFSEYTCSVYSASGKKEDGTTFNVPSSVAATGEPKPEPTGMSKVVAPVVVIGSLIVGLLIALLLLYRRCSRRDNRVPTNESDVEANQEMGKFCKDFHT